MMIRNKISLLLISMFLATAIFAQPCGITYETRQQIAERLLESKEILRLQPIQQRSVRYVPVQFHIVRKTDGTGGVSEQRVFAQVCQLNEIYNEFDIVFYLKPFNYIDNTNVYTNHSSFTGTSVMNGQYDQHALNIYVVEDANTLSGPGGTTLGYYSPAPIDWIVVRVDKVGGTQITLTHEIGHYFSLLHTFEGWDHTPYEASYGNPVGTYSPEGVLNECQDGSNCATAGDMICDTPPDYNFGYYHSSGGCNYPGAVGDPCGGTTDPDEENIMGYFIGCQAVFSQGQKDIINASLTSRSEINLPYIPGHADITDSPTLALPAHNGTSQGYNSVFFEWSAVEGADYYFIEIANTPSFNMNSSRHTAFVYGTSKWISDFFLPQTTYWWRVLAVNDIGSCAGASSKNRFTSGTDIINGIVDMEVATDWTVGPNPVHNTQGIRLNVVTKDSFDSKIKLYDLKGSLIVASKMKKFTIGETNHNLHLSGQNTGVYILSIDTPKGRLSKKVFITE